MSHTIWVGMGIFIALQMRLFHKVRQIRPWLFRLWNGCHPKEVRMQEEVAALPTGRQA
jgi:hypothetical protein